MIGRPLEGSWGWGFVDGERARGWFGLDGRLYYHHQPSYTGDN
jgi:hypothetical protein